MALKDDILMIICDNSLTRGEQLEKVAGLILGERLDDEGHKDLINGIELLTTQNECFYDNVREIGEYIKENDLIGDIPVTEAPEFSECSS